MSFYDCQGNRHNKIAFAGPYDECGRIDVFGIWKQSVKEKKSKDYVEALMDHYDIPVHYAPQGMESEINKFYQAKFGMFTCHDTLARIGGVRYAEDLIDYWVRNKEDQKWTWYLAIGYVLSEKGGKKHDLLKAHKKGYRESQAFKNYLKNHPDHLYEVEDIITRQECKELFEKQDKEKLAEKIMKRTNNIF